MMDKSLASSENSGWSSLYKIGGVAAWIFVAYSLATIIIFMVLSQMPETALEAFNALQENRIIGLLRLDALTLLTVPLYYLIYLCIYQGIKKDNKAFASLGVLLAFAGITLFLATPSAFSLVSLSDKYAAATTATQKEQILTVGEALMASDMWHSSGAMIGGYLMLIAALIVSVVMLKSENFSRATAIVGIVTYGLDLIHKLVSIFAPNIGIFFMMVAGPLYLVWFPLLARDLFRLGRADTEIKLSKS
jgi:hypothetical protein